MNHAPLCPKALSSALGVSDDYVYAMRAAGAPFWGRVSTVAAIMEWWAMHPDFTYRKSKSNKNKIKRAMSGKSGITVL